MGGGTRRPDLGPHYPEIVAEHSHAIAIAAAGRGVVAHQRLTAALIDDFDLVAGIFRAHARLQQLWVARPDRHLHMGRAGGIVAYPDALIAAEAENGDGLRLAGLEIDLAKIV